jgi:pyridinium-3,5-biscarboxylic acid mononucleotide synthase
MDETTLLGILEDVADGVTDPAAALAAVRSLPFADLGFARVDHHRELRQGFPEAVYSPGKTVDQCAAIVAELLSGPTTGPVLLTRVEPDKAAPVLARVPGGAYDESARLATWRRAGRRPGEAVIACAGTSDLPVADEAAATLAALGWPPARLTDVGVAGLHRLLAGQEALTAADVVIVVAGMEGALASAVGGLVAAPVVAVPTSAGYGSSLEGITALLAMLASCAPGVTVVGIDNGYGAALAAARLLARLERGSGPRLAP